MNRRPGASSIRTLAIAATVMLAGLGLPGTAAATAVGTTTTFSVSPNPWPYCSAVTWLSNVTANGPADGSSPTGSVLFFDVTNGAHTQVGSGTLTAASTAVSVSNYSCLSIGSHDVQAEFTSTNPAYANSMSSPYSITVGAGPSHITMSGAQTVEQHSATALTMDLIAGHDVAGTLALYRQGNGTPICTLPNIHSQGGGLPSCLIPTATTGVFTYYATWTSSDTATVLSSQSDNYQVTVTPDLVHAHGVVNQYSSIYPVTDGYRDTDKISGVRDEPISVSIRIYNPGGSLVKSVSIALGAGSYSTTWNGRNSSGTVLAEGKYKVVQTLKDAFNTTSISTTYITLSKKHLIWHASTVTKLGSQLSSSGHAGAGTVSINTTTHVARLSAPNIYNDWAGAGYAFTLPTAISYRYIAVKFYAKKQFLVGGEARIGAQNFTTCVYSSLWDESCFDAWHEIGNQSGATQWWSTGSLSSAHRYGRTVRGILTNIGGSTYIYKAQVSFQYSTLGY